MKVLHEERWSMDKLSREAGCNAATAWRWATKGARGAILESILIGGRRITSRQAFERFVQRTTGVSTVDRTYADHS